MLSLLAGEGTAFVGADLRVSRAELRAASAALAARLHALGFRRGDRLALWLSFGDCHGSSGCGNRSFSFV